MKPHSAASAMSDGAILVDLRSQDQRGADGDIPGALVIEPHDLELRLDPRSETAVIEATSADVQWILISDGGGASALAAASLRALGLVNTTDVEGGFQEWWEGGLPVIELPRPRTPRP